VQNLAPVLASMPSLRVFSSLPISERVAAEIAMVNDPSGEVWMGKRVGSADGHRVR
jgi:hypothetical protein